MDIKELLAQLKLNHEQLEELKHLVKENPVAAFSKIKELGITPEVVQKLVNIVASQQHNLSELAEKVPLSSGMLEKLKKSMEGVFPKNLDR